MSREDNELIIGILKGQKNDYAVLIRRHESKVRALCRSYLPDALQADEAAQDVFVLTYKNLKKFHQTSAFSTWLHRIAVNHCIDLTRRKKRQAEVSLEILIEQGSPQLQDSVSFEKALETGDLSQKLLAQLNETDREVLVLREISGLDYQEIADNLKVSVEAVRSRLKRAREALLKIARHFLSSQNV